MITKAYKALVGDDVKFNLIGTTLDGVVWLDESLIQPSDADVQAKVDEFEAADTSAFATSKSVTGFLQKPIGGLLAT